jgi:hypothetical protein
LHADGKLIIGAFSTRVNKDNSSTSRLKYYCFDSSELGINLGTSTNRIPPPNPVLIHTNPTREEIAISAPVGFASRSTIEVYNIKGDRVAVHNWCGGRACTIDVRKLTPGAYVVKLLDLSSQQMLTGRFVKN